jgi:ADP-heptose:LPS heptosyltransferase
MEATIGVAKMKILALSLLRLGDLFMHLQVLREVQRQMPEAEISIVINSQFAHARPIIAEVLRVKNIHLFNRTELQRSLLDKSVGLFAAFDDVSDWMTELKEEKYDLVFNLTHNLLSARLIDCLGIEEVRGVSFKDGISKGITNPSLKYLNEFYREDAEYSLHFVDILKLSMGLPRFKSDVEVETLSSQRSTERILVQAFSAEEKKEWPLNRWIEWVKVVREAGCDLPIEFLSSPSEVERYSVMRAVFVPEDKVEITVPSLTEIRDKVPSSLLVSVDTSIKHLAALYGGKVIELSIGSSNPFKTSAYVSNSWILHSLQECCPCSHSLPCLKPSKVCANDITPTQLAAATLAELGLVSASLVMEAAGTHTAVFKTKMSSDFGIEIVAHSPGRAEVLADEAEIKKRRIMATHDDFTGVL